jgi:hypothetical protein
MNLNLENKSLLIFSLLVVFAVLVSVSCISAADADNTCIEKGCAFTMSAPYNAGTGYHWEISPETYGVHALPVKTVEDHPGTCGSSATAYFKFIPTSSDYYVKLVLISPTGDIVKELDSDMLN